ncbi:cobalamin biosynthesis protein [Variovorax sp. SRS16]|uniref:adenosylcobinamide-phosphate synthase CbiB n=1 Tax=Variovorax sp. SRS16 TaxID=282217 RepID=UPI001317408F|nr:adenosylcobinamide-phosphate synthase CbiB [Variovorax sp. SRS16]VTU19337.1 cobalamin biosynthesis protein [Variovorax sp. SRS16]
MFAPAVWLPPPLGEGWGGGTTVLIGVAALLLAMAIDHWLGEPPARWHPVVWIGRYLGWIGRRIAPRAEMASRARDLPRLVAGAAAWWGGAAMVFCAAWIVAAIAERLPPWAAAVLIGLALKPLLAWRMLRDEVLAVEAALGRSLEEGRAQLARLVSRDAKSLSECEVRESAIESLAENLNDSLVAPLFWFVLGGLPGAAIYRFANTADAMWGYRGERAGRVWEWAGKWAARADDLLSWLPARLTALVLLLCSLALRGRAGLGAIRREADQTPSPNSGWPMAAMALLLDVRLAKPGVYTLHAAGRAATSADISRAVDLASRTVIACAVCAVIAIAGLSAIGWP